MGLVGTPDINLESFFPDGAFDDIFDQRVVSGAPLRTQATIHLRAMDEKSLFMGDCSRRKCLRFTWLRPFSRPTIIRVEFLDAKSARLIFKQTDGRGGFETGALVVSNTLILQEIETYKLKKLIGQLPAVQRKGRVKSIDGAAWIVEYRIDESYFVMEESSPHKGAIFDIGRFLLASIPFEGAEIRNRASWYQNK